MTAPAEKRPTPDEVLREYAKDTSPGFMDAWERMVIRDGLPAKRVRFVLRKLVDRGLYEYGVRIERGWLTSKGREALA